MTIECITISTGRRTTKVNLSDVLYIERNLRKVRIVTDQDEIEYYQRLENLIPLLDSRFFPCLKGCYINFDRVKSMEEQQIIFDCGKRFYLGRTNFIRTRKAYKKYWKNPAESEKKACNYNRNNI